jgi:hypothetical protein
MELAPAQILFLQKPSKVKVYEIMEATVQDLILRGIIRFEKIQSYPNSRSKKPQKYFMLMKGPKFEGYEPANFEKGLLKPLADNDKVMTKLVTDSVLKKYSMPASFINTEIYKPLNHKKYISGLPILKAFGVYSVSGKARQALQEIEHFVNEQTEKLRQNINNHQIFFGIVTETGWFVFLIKHQDVSFFKEIVAVVKKIKRNNEVGPGKLIDEYLEAFEVNFEHHE